MEEKKILYIVRYPSYEDFNLRGKFDGQLKAFERLGLDVYYLTFDREYFYLVHKDKKERLCRATSNWPMYFHTKVYLDMHRAVLKAVEMIRFNFVYWRMAPVWYSSYKVGKTLHNKGIKTLYEIPTFCKVGEAPQGVLRKLFAFYSRIWEEKLMKYPDLIVMIFTEDADVDTFFGKPVAVINNGVDVESIPMRKPVKESDGIHILALASMSYWHGYDRLIRSISQYSGSQKVTLHMVGGNDGGMLPEWKKLASDLNVEDRVIFHGKMYGDQLSEMFDLCDVGVNALAQYKKNLGATSELKVREYTARGLPFLCSIEDPALEYAEEPFWMKVANDDSIPDMQQIVDFANRMREDKDHPAKMRDYAQKHMTWESQYAPIFDKFS